MSTSGRQDGEGRHRRSSDRRTKGSQCRLEWIVLTDEPVIAFGRASKPRSKMSLRLFSPGTTGIAKGYFAEVANLAGRQGFEPRYRGPEPRVLPLDDLPVLKVRRDGTTDYSEWRSAPATASDAPLRRSASREWGRVRVEKPQSATRPSIAIDRLADCRDRGRPAPKFRCGRSPTRVRCASSSNKRTSAERTYPPRRGTREGD